MTEMASGKTIENVAAFTEFFNKGGHHFILEGNTLAADFISHALWGHA